MFPRAQLPQKTCCLKIWIMFWWCCWWWQKEEKHWPWNFDIVRNGDFRVLPFSRVVLHNATLQNFFLRIGFKCSRKAGRQHPSKYDSRHKTPYSSTQEMHLGEKRAFSHTYIATTKYSDRQKWINKKVTTLHILKVDACCIYSIILHLLLLFSVCMFIFMLKE